MAAARAEARALATPARASAAALPRSVDLQATVPGYSPGEMPQAAYYDDPGGLSSSGTSAALSSDPWRLVTDPGRIKVTLPGGAFARAKEIEDDPNRFVGSETLSSADSTCQALPPSTGGTGYYEATCNEGLRVDQGARTCRVPLVVTVTPGERRWRYACETKFDKWRHNGDRLCFLFDDAVAGGLCTVTGKTRIGMTCLQQGRYGCAEPGEPNFAQTLSCSAEVRPGGSLEAGAPTVTDERDERQCESVLGPASCRKTAETCTDSSPRTRTVSGAQITRSCWAWQRRYECTATSEASDCGDLETRPRCSFVREACLDDPRSGPCKVREKVYRCPVPGDDESGARQYVCGGDVYCINGDCEPVEREASTEFKDAVVGLHVLGQANAEFDRKTLTLFSGERQTCHRKLFGTLNCCAGKGLPLLTPAFCSSAEKDLDKRDRMGLCHYAGSYCSDKVLGICVTKKKAYCCFASKLTRILQEQGRPQIGKAWNSAKKESCKGFSVDEFAALDLSVMDFTEVYGEFTDAARLPDEIETSRRIQTRIQAYYDDHEKK